MRKVALVLCGVLVAILAVVVYAAVTEYDFSGQYGVVYDIVYDGRKGELVLSPLAKPGLKSVLKQGGVEYGVRYQIVRPQDAVDGQAGPGYQGVPMGEKYRIVFWVDFARTPRNTQDDQRFDGYMMTLTKSAIAGVTWRSKCPYGFYAIRKYDVPG
jgi:hypothetical protein